MKPAEHGFPVRAEFGEDGGRYALFLLEEGVHDVFGVPLGVAVAAYDFLGLAEDFAGLFGEVFGA